MVIKHVNKHNNRSCYFLNMAITVIIVINIWDVHNESKIDHQARVAVNLSADENSNRTSIKSSVRGESLVIICLKRDNEIGNDSREIAARPTLPLIPKVLEMPNDKIEIERNE